ncbi:NUMOD1 domain-containing DNA-binding protein [Novosphingobium sp. 9U]|uniref:NUMOD1 domain-containing DNA-binding protein n=1 Tax=Novosphingobium sp. 9U TaxID=2653158 RepID=UPI0012F228CC|nr:NUMOD1 domain-containing DNA-binding protein [Novosphingobium sp. 9U]VWX50452.1 hypothetical protein NOVOSPHI9U_290008 [Novosphingobium sp. 9U]
MTDSFAPSAGLPPDLTGSSYVPRVVHAEGRTFASIREASRELGITAVTVRARLRRKEPGYFVEEVETDQPVTRFRKDGRPVVINGVRYLTLRAAAMASDITVNRVKRQIERGVEGWFYEDEGPLVDKRRDIRRPVVIDSVVYESGAYAARELKISRATVVTRLQSSKFPNYAYKE